MPDKIGRFDILGEIARSSAACIYKALDPESGQTVALKAVDIKLLGEHSAEILRQALQEADSTKILNSHNLVLLYGAGEIDGYFCSTMEYVQGNSIASMLTRGDEFSIWDLQDIVRQACQGFDHAHAHKIVHYSLEPAKLMVGWDGTVKVLGFGISALSTHTAHLLAPGETMLPYMSPEQLRGEPLDARSNLFTLGAILYEMVTGQKPFPGTETDHLMQAILTGDLTPPNQINPKIHALISEVILKALEKNPKDRFQSGQELVNALERRKEEAKPALGVNGPSGTVQASQKKIAAQSPAAAEAPAMEMISALDSSAQAAPVQVRPKAAAAAAGANGSGAAGRVLNTKAAAVSSPAASPRMSSSAPAPAVDPLMAEPVRGKATRSFSEIDELPPIRESQASATASAAIDPLQELRQTQFPTQPRGEKPKAQPAEVAKKAVEEIRKTPPKLFLYSIGAAAIIILLVIALIASRIHKENAGVDTGGSASATSDAQGTGQADASAQSLAAAPQTTPLSASGKAATTITIKSKSVRKNTGKVTAPVSVQVPGQLTVNSIPTGAQITIDGRGEPGWLTPYDVTGLAPGQHTVSLSKSGFTSETRNIEVASRSRFSLVVQLTQLAATVLVTAEPAGAQILLDGKDTGRVTPSQVSVEKAGNHTVLVRKQGYLEESTTVNLQPGQSFRYSPTLRQLGSTDEIKTAGKLKKLFGGAPDGMGAVTVKTQPKGAQIAVNRHILDKTSPAEFYLNPGNYVIDISMTGYKSLHRVVTIEKGSKLAIEESLDRD